MKKPLIVGILLVVAGVIALAVWPKTPNVTKSPNYEPLKDQSALNTKPLTASHDHQAMGRVPAYHHNTPAANALRGTLSPEIFTGNVRLAYQAAKDIPTVLAQLPCYCHCDMSQGHKSLHSCFEDEHGANCGICIGEAVMANNLTRQGLTPTQIRERIVTEYGSDSGK